MASECPLILQQPKPDVVFENFGTNGLDFALHTIVPDIARSFAAQTDLRTRITHEFRAAGVEIPYAQYDVRLRDLDMLRSFFTRLQEERAGTAGEAVPGTQQGASSGSQP